MQKRKHTCIFIFKFLQRFILFLCGLTGIEVVQPDKAQTPPEPAERTKPQWKVEIDFCLGDYWNATDEYWETVIEESNQWRARSLARKQFDELYPRASQVLVQSERVDAGRNIKLKRERPTKSAAGYIYLIEGQPNHYKIGKTVNPKERIGTLGVQLPYPIQVIHLIPVDNMTAAEQYLHSQFGDKRIRGEWFELDAQEVAFIKSISRLGSDVLQ